MFGFEELGAKPPSLVPLGVEKYVQDYVPNCAGTLQLVPAETLDKEAQN